MEKKKTKYVREKNFKDQIELHRNLRIITRFFVHPGVNTRGKGALGPKHKHINLSQHSMIEI